MHADRRESDLTPIPQETLDLWKQHRRGPRRTVGDASTADNAARPWSLWRYALLLVLITAIIESVTREPISFGGEGGRLNALDQLNGYLQRLEKRLRFLALSKGTSLVTVSALVITVALVWIINRYAFSPASLLSARILLFLSVAVAIAFGLVIPLLHLNRRNAARQAEQKFPDFQERLLTLAEKPNASDPFLAIAGRRHHAGRRIQRARAPGRHRSHPRIPGIRRLSPSLCLLWLIHAGPGYLGYGTSLAVGRCAEVRKSRVLRYRRQARRPHRAPQGRSISHRAAPRLRFAQSPAVRAIPRHIEVGASGHAADARRLHLRVSVQQPGR